MEETLAPEFKVDWALISDPDAALCLSQESFIINQRGQESKSAEWERNRTLLINKSYIERPWESSAKFMMCFASFYVLYRVLLWIFLAFLLGKLLNWSFWSPIAQILCIPLSKNDALCLNQKLRCVFCTIFLWLSICELNLHKWKIGNVHIIKWNHI